VADGDLPRLGGEGIRVGSVVQSPLMTLERPVPDFNSNGFAGAQVVIFSWNGQAGVGRSRKLARVN
jgi:hypothetical protein